MSFLAEALIFLGAAVVVVPVCKRLGLSPVLGYLGTGVLIGQPGFALIGNAHEVLHFAEIGVVLLLFVIGLELHPRRLWVMRRLVFGLGISQVVVTAAVLGALLMLAGLGGGSSLLLGFALALSSTAFVLQLLGEQKKLNQPHGRASFGVLLLQDVAVIPGIAAVNLLAVGGADAGEPLRPGLIAAVIAGTVAARFLLRPILRFVAESGIHELFTAAALALVAGAALAMGEAGLSMGLGAFVAGMVVADSEYRHQLEADVAPFKGLLLGLFFIAVGMSVNVGLLADRPVLVVGLTLALMAAKTAVIVPLARWHGLTWAEALRTGLMLSQGGEFAFVLLTAAVTAGLVAGQHAELAVLVVTLSMAATPALVAAGDRWLSRGRKPEPVYDEIDRDDSPVIVTGFGRVGQIVARVLTMRHIPFTALDVSPEHVEFVRQYGNKVYFGDATRLEVLRAAGVDKARAVVVAVGTEDASMKIVERLRTHFPKVPVLARATTRHHELRLREAGVPVVLRDTLYSSLRLASDLLQQLGLSAADAEAAVEQFRKHDADTLTRQAAVFGDEAAFRKTTIDATAELTRLFAEDAAAVPDADPDATKPAR